MPVPLRTYADEKNIYSVDMMLAYLNTHKHPVTELPMTEFEWQLQQDVWGDWSPADVLKNPKAKKYAENSERIKKADLSYPVIVTAQGHKLVDGYHRVAKAFSQGKKTVQAVIFPASLMRKFILNDELNFVKVHQQTSLHEILELWAKRF